MVVVEERAGESCWKEAKVGLDNGYKRQFCKKIEDQGRHSPNDSRTTGSGRRASKRVAKFSKKRDH